jgi:voltage-gated potassium channel Kch
MGERHVCASTRAKRFTDSIYWTVTTMTSTGYGDILPATDSERIFAAFVMLAGKLLYGFIIGNITSTMVRSEKRCFW